MLDDSTIDDTNSDKFELVDQQVVLKASGNVLKIGDVLRVRCDEIIPSMMDVVVISHLLDNIK